MKNIFRKAASVVASTALVGMTMGIAAAADYPSPFTSNTAVVYGSNAAASDISAATNIVTGLKAVAAGETVTTLSGATGVTEDEVVLGTVINSTGYKIETTMTDTKVTSLLDEKISWDDGDGSDEYDIHEAIVIGGEMKVLTSLDDEDLTGAALSNNMALEYRLYFDDAIPLSASTAANADDLYLTILGKSYEVTNMTATTISVVTSSEHSVGIGEAVTVDGKTFTVDDLSSTSARINGVTIAEGASKKIDGLQVEVDADSIFYNENFPEQASLTLKIGEDISKTYSNGDEYIGEDEDDPLWVWTFSDPTTSGGYIGIQYNVNTNDADDNEAGDSIKYAGAGYILPEDFAEVKLDGLTDVGYEDIKISFTTRDLYNSSDNGVANEDEEVIVISGPSTDSITVGSEETDEIYIFLANNATITDQTVSAGLISNGGLAGGFGALEVFYKDHDGDNTPTNKARYESIHNLTGAGALIRAKIGEIDIGDTTVDIDATIVGGVMTLSFENPDDDDINLTIGGVAIANTTGTLIRLGATAEDADANDITVNGTDVSTKEESVMDYYGIFVGRDDSGGVEGNADEDEIVLSIPDDQVYAIVSVVAGGQATTTGGDAGIMVISDAEVGSAVGKNLIVVGGSAINSVAAELLGGSYGEAAFTAQTGVAPGQFVIQSFSRSGKTALLVAGYNGPDTEKGQKYLSNYGSEVDTTIGKKYIGSSDQSASMVVS